MATFGRMRIKSLATGLSWAVAKLAVWPNDVAICFVNTS